MVISVSITDISLKTKRVLDLVEDGRKIVIMRHNKPIAVLMSLADSDVELEAWEDDED